MGTPEPRLLTEVDMRHLRQDADALVRGAFGVGGSLQIDRGMFARIVATLEALQRERDEWKAAYQEVINGHS